jgi:acyl carrier protein
LDALPVTQNGKLDRRALPAPDPGQLSSRPDFTAPRNDAEEKIAAVWRQILKVERIDVHDDFFDLGGHSLAAMQVITRLRAALSATLNVTQIFNHPTIASLADAINREPAAAVPDEADEGVL